MYKFNSFTMQQVDENIQLLKIKAILKKVSKAQTVGSVVTIVLPPTKDVGYISSRLDSEMAGAQQIKNKKNKNSVLEAQKAAKQILKRYRFTPKNGLVIFCGRIIDTQGREKKISSFFEPLKPLNSFVYSCSNKFEVEKLKEELLSTGPKFGFVIIDGLGAYFATLQGNSTKKLALLTVDLPNKHNNGGQSQLRHERNRQHERYRYLTEVCEKANDLFIEENRCNVTGIIVGGSADFKYQFEKANRLDPRLSEKIVKVIELSYGFKKGFMQAINKCQQFFFNFSFQIEKQIIESFFDHISQDDGYAVYKAEQTMAYLEAGTIKTIICNEDLDIKRIQVKDLQTEKVSVVYLKDGKDIRKEINYEKYQVLQNEDDDQYLVDWLLKHHQEFGSELKIVSDKTPEGTQFLKTFGGIAGVLRYKVNLNHGQCEEYESESEDDQFF